MNNSIGAADFLYDIKNMTIEKSNLNHNTHWKEIFRKARSLQNLRTPDFQVNIILTLHLISYLELLKTFEE